MSDSQTVENASFQLTYSAIKMFGKQLYSNASSAISELVANGIDAKADTIRILMDVTDKKRSKIEIFDNGKGMSSADIKTKYILIGYNKRKVDNDTKTMGRKGIGKLAALFLSDRFFIFTKSKNTNEESTWLLDVSNTSDDDIPNLLKQDQQYNGYFKNEFNKSTGGTIISLENVDLSGFAERTFEALKVKLSNLFLFDKLDARIEICIRENNGDPYTFQLIKKCIAFKNMCCIYKSSSEDFSDIENDTYKMKYRTKLNEEKVVIKNIKVKDFSEINGLEIKGRAVFEGKEKEYELKGWIGIHSTIDSDEAIQNDDKFIKNRVYSPNQLRVYVRNKLAVSNVLEHLGNTRAFANYIEGEVSFDILDDNDLSDISTAGRQDFDTSDERFQLLIKLLVPIANSLVRFRQSVADSLKELKEDEDRRINARAKAIFSRDVKKELDQIPNITNDVRKRALEISLSKIDGEVEAKRQFTIFISHASKDSIFSDFVYNFLCSKGFCGDDSKEECEIFYSSNGLDNDNLDPLSMRIRDFITAKNNDILFLTSKNFKNSEFCLFEGGAAWATKGIEDYKVWNLDIYENIPKFLTNGKSEYVFDALCEQNYNLKPNDYINLVKIINRLINHLNKNNEVSGRDPINELRIPIIPNDVQLMKLGKNYVDYYDKELMEYWNVYVKNKSLKYIEDNKT